jgi:hypothetical protein
MVFYRRKLMENMLPDGLVIFWIVPYFIEKYQNHKDLHTYMKEYIMYKKIRPRIYYRYWLNM